MIRAAMTDKPRRIFVECSEPRLLASGLIGTAWVIGVHIEGDQLQIEATDAPMVARDLPRIALDNDVAISRLEPADESLESVFRYLVGR